MKLLTASLICLVLLTTLGLGWVFDKTYENLQPQLVPIDATTAAEQIGQQLAQVIDQNPSPQLAVQQNKTGYHLQLLAMDELGLPLELQQQLKQGQVLLLETQQGLGFHYWLERHQQVLVLHTPHLSRNQQNSPINFAFTLAFYLVLILIFTLWIRPLIKQLMALRDASKALGEGKLDKRIKQSSISYIRDIEQEFDRMAARIQQLVEDVKLLSTGVSHDLRTPLARLHLGLDTLEEVEDPTHRHKLQQRLSRDLDEMTQLVESILSYARLEQNRLQLNKQKLNLVSLLQKQADKIACTGAELVFHHPEQVIEVIADANYLQMLFTNLLQNALNYGQGKIQLTVQTEQNKVQILVEDNGPGIKPELRDSICKPFVRGEKQHNQGYGFGLAIVSRILEWHDGELKIEQSPALGGACFVITFPYNS